MVVDIGTCTTRVGFAGEDIPKCVFDTACGVIDEKGDSSSSNRSSQKVLIGRDKNRPREYMNIVSPVVDGLVENWDCIEQIYEYSFRKHLHVDTHEHPLMIVETNFNTLAKREKLLELVFETFEFPAVYLAKSAVLSCFAIGRTTALVLDCGHGATTTVPVHEGYALNKGLRRTRMAGAVLDAVTQKIIFSKLDVPTRYNLQREAVNDKVVNKRLVIPNITPSYDQFMKRMVIRDFKETLSRVAESDMNVGNVPLEKYELPDGNVLDIGAPRFHISECLFQRAEGKQISGLEGSDFPGMTFKGLQHMVAESVGACDVDVRKEMYNNIILTGGTSLIPGFGARLTNELNADLPAVLKTKVVAPSNGIERTFGAWVGGAILGSLGTFHQMWLSRQEYAEQGASILAQKCP